MTAIENDDREGSRWVVVGSAKPFFRISRLKSGEAVMLVGTKSGTPQALPVQQESKMRRPAHPVRNKIVLHSISSVHQSTGKLDELSAEFDQLVSNMQSQAFKQKLDMALSSISSVRLTGD